MIGNVFALQNSRNKLLFASFAFIVFAMPAKGQAAVAQQNASPKAFTYEAVTIKPDPSGNGFWRHTADGFSTGGMPTTNLIRSAFGLLMDDQIIGLPTWARSEPLAIQAKTDADTAAALDKLPPAQRWKQTQLMMQALLADRFALKFHHATKDLPIYELAVAKDGFKMKKSPTDLGGGGTFSDGRVEAKAISVWMFAANLSFSVGRMVVDKTGLEGSYDFTLEWAPEGADASDTRPSIFTALEEQLGLKLESARGPVDVIVIDRIERPSEN